MREKQKQRLNLGLCIPPVMPKQADYCIKGTKGMTYTFIFAHDFPCSVGFCCKTQLKLIASQTGFRLIGNTTEQLDCISTYC